jgi:hypothetical protein
LGKGPRRVPIFNILFTFTSGISQHSLFIYSFRNLTYKTNNECYWEIKEEYNSIIEDKICKVKIPKRKEIEILSEMELSLPKSRKESRNGFFLPFGIDLNAMPKREPKERLGSWA